MTIVARQPNIKAFSMETDSSVIDPRETRFLRLPQVKATTGLSKTTIYEKVKEQSFPSPVQIGKRAVAWVESEVAQWATDQVSASRDVKRPFPTRRASTETLRPAFRRSA